jgi:hypothetical protein
MLMPTLFPLAGVISALVEAKWGAAIAYGVLGGLLFLAVRREWRHWREMIPGRHRATSLN